MMQAMRSPWQCWRVWQGTTAPASSAVQIHHDDRAAGCHRNTLRTGADCYAYHGASIKVCAVLQLGVDAVQIGTQEHDLACDAPVCPHQEQDCSNDAALVWWSLGYPKRSRRAAILQEATDGS
jgi:hypothetical protein